MVQDGPVELLKVVLEHLDSPERLEDHPWAHSRMVQEQCALRPALQERPAGRRLAETVVQIFRDSLPPAPPRQGKRLDTRWAQFGLLAARYFAPFAYNLPYPSSLREAWHGMDAAILAFTFDARQDVEETERARYRLVVNEPEPAPESTLSDWHRNGIERLAASIERREANLQNLPAAPAEAEIRAKPSRLRTWLTRSVLLAGAVLLIAGIVLGGLKARKVYDLALVVWGDAQALRQMAGSEMELSAIKDAGPALTDLRQDFDLLKDEIEPFAPFGPWLRWVPVYGGDLASGGQLLQIADLVLTGGERSLTALTPLVEAVQADTPLKPTHAVVLLNEASPALSLAREDLRQASALRAEMDAAQLSPRTRGLMEQYLDPLLPRLEDGLDVALALPGFMGATSAGPRTYLLLAQNEDELRPTGGFITAVGNLVVKDGQILSLSFKDTGIVDNWDMPYPSAPWQLQDYMNSPVLLLRDSNWFTDFPVTAEYAEYLYSYFSSHSVDGVIAFDQHSLVMLLQALGPVPVEGQAGYVDASNVLTFMRRAKTLGPADGIYPSDWTSKSFLGDLAAAVMRKLYSTSSGDWPKVMRFLLDALDEKHLMLQVDDPALAGVLASYGWNGAVTANPGDFLMVVDSNVGFNKTNAAVTTRLIYDVNLTDLTAPTGSLTVVHQNGSPRMDTCEHWDKVRTPGQEKYPIDDCYWDYMRVYVPGGATLLSSDAQDIPAAWLIQGKPVKAVVDVLDVEEIGGLQAFGTMLVVPGGRSVQTGLEYSLPPGILTVASSGVTYRLTVKKQPGTVAVPITVRLHLPAGARVESPPEGAVVQGNNLLFQLDLRRDIHLEVAISLR